MANIKSERTEEKKEQLDRIRMAFRESDIRKRIPNYLLTILDQKDDADIVLVCVPEDLPARFVFTALAAFWGNHWKRCKERLKNGFEISLLEDYIRCI